MFYLLRVFSLASFLFLGSFDALAQVESTASSVDLSYGKSCDAKGNVVCVFFNGTPEALRLLTRKEGEWSKLNELHTVRLSHIRLTKEHVASLANLSQMRTLLIGGSSGCLETYVAKNVYATLPLLSQLEELQIVNTVNSFGDENLGARDFRFIKKMGNLKKIHLYDADISTEGLDVISSLPRLEIFESGAKVHCRDSKVWQRLFMNQCLKEVQLGCFEKFDFQEVFLKPESIPLEKLSLNGVGDVNILKVHDIAAITSLSNLQVLELSGNLLIKAESLTALSTSKKLQRLKINVHGKIESFEFLKDLVNLKSLTCTAQKVDSYDALIAHPKLEVLNLNINLDSENIVYFSKIPALKKLTVSRTNLPVKEIHSSLIGVDVYVRQ